MPLSPHDDCIGDRDSSSACHLGLLQARANALSNSQAVTEDPFEVAKTCGMYRDEQRCIQDFRPPFGRCTWNGTACSGVHWLMGVDCSQCTNDWDIKCRFATEVGPRGYSACITADGQDFCTDADGHIPVSNCNNVDCEWGPFSEWGHCTKSCGGGEQVRSRWIVRPAVNQGAACDGYFVETQKCNEHACFVDSMNSTSSYEVDQHEPDSALATCKLYGGLNLMTLDEGETSAEPADMHFGDFWLLKNDDVKIQGRVKAHRIDGTSKSWLRVLAVGGRLLNNNTLKFGTHRVYWNNEEILPSRPSQYYKALDDKGAALSIKYLPGAPLVGDEDQPTPGYEVELPSGVKLEVNHGQSPNLDVKISVPSTWDNNEGVCAGQLVHQRRHMKIPVDEQLIGHEHDI